MSNTPVFLHATFRSCSTWWWAQSRKLENVRAFYEPLHHNLEDRTHAECNENHHGKDKATLYRHPWVENHYFSEYPLKQEGGIKLYLSRFGFDNYALHEDDVDPELSKYIQTLIQFAQQQKQRPVLQFNRSTLRGAWMKAQFGGDHIYLNRSPQFIMNSVRSFLKPKEGEVSNADFSAFFLATVGQNSDHPIFKETAQTYGLKRIKTISFGSMIDNYKKTALTMNDQDLQDIIGFIWFTGLVHASSYADLIVDQELMSKSDYSQNIQERIRSQFGLHILLNGFKHSAITEPEFTISDKMQRLMSSSTKYIAHDIEKIQSMVIAQDSRRHLDMVLSA